MSGGNDTIDVLPSADQSAQDPAMTALLGALSSGGDPLALLYSQIGATNPQAAMILQAMEQRRAQAAAQIKDIEDDDACEEQCHHVKPEPGTVQVNEEDLRALQDAARRAGEELEVLRGRSDILARALGACYLCFGDNPLCPECAGVGTPGSLMPEPAEFRLYVVPALRRVRTAEAHLAHRGRRREFQGVRPDRSRGPDPHSPATGSRQVEPPIQP